MNEIEYEETIIKTMNKNIYEHFINDLKETYRPEFGWHITLVDKTKINEQDINITLLLQKINTTEKSKSR